MTQSDPLATSFISFRALHHLSISPGTVTQMRSRLAISCRYPKKLHIDGAGTRFNQIIGVRDKADQTVSLVDQAGLLFPKVD